MASDDLREMLRDMLKAFADDEFAGAVDETVAAIGKDEPPVVVGMALQIQLPDGAESMGSYYVLTSRGLYYGIRRKRGLFSSSRVGEMILRGDIKTAWMSDHRTLELAGDARLMTICFPGTIAPGRYLQFVVGQDVEYQTPADQAETLVRALGLNTNEA